MPEIEFTGSFIYSQNPIVKKTFEFAIGIVAFAEELEEKKKFVIARQVIRSGTSIGANVKEAQNAESKADFIHKMKIALKEADETEYWLFLCSAIPNYPKSVILLDKLDEILKILNKIVSSAKRSKLIR